jgi:hypothetical protein
MSELAPSSPPEVDFLGALRARGLALVAVGAALGASVGLGAANAFLRRHEAHATFRVATLGLMGPAVPLSEVRARAESRSMGLAALTAGSIPNPEGEVSAYKVTAEPDASRDGTVVSLTVVGPEAAATLAVAQGVLDGVMRFTHESFSAAMKEHQEQLARAIHATDAFTQAAGAHPAGNELAEQTVAALEFERWAGEVSSTRQRAQREVLTSRDSEVIDAPYLHDSNTRTLLVAALGAFAGMLLGLAMAVRPQPPRP